MRRREGHGEGDRVAASVLSLVLLLLVPACDGTDGPRAQPVLGRGPAETRIGQPLAEDPALPGPGRPSETQHAPILAGPGRTRAAAASTPGPAPAEPAPPAHHDLSAALQRAFGAPESCISAPTRERLSDTLRIQLSVRVTPSGRVVDATVSGRDLSESDLECLRQRAARVRLPGPIEAAPRTVSTTVEYRVESTPSTSEEPTQPERRLAPGTLAPDSTLPAGGSVAERPRGFVAPSSTLPATVD